MVLCPIEHVIFSGMILKLLFGNMDFIGTFPDLYFRFSDLGLRHVHNTLGFNCMWSMINQNCHLKHWYYSQYIWPVPSFQFNSFHTCFQLCVLIYQIIISLCTSNRPEVRREITLWYTRMSAVLCICYYIVYYRRLRGAISWLRHCHYGVFDGHGKTSYYKVHF